MFLCFHKFHCYRDTLQDFSGICYVFVVANESRIHHLHEQTIIVSNVSGKNTNCLRVNGNRHKTKWKNLKKLAREKREILKYEILKVERTKMYNV